MSIVKIPFVFSRRFYAAAARRWPVATYDATQRLHGETSGRQKKVAQT
jgi:hypothetical protein